MNVDVCEIVLCCGMIVEMVDASIVSNLIFHSVS